MNKNFHDLADAVGRLLAKRWMEKGVRPKIVFAPEARPPVRTTVKRQRVKRPAP